MKYTDFQHLARLFAVGALDSEELESFTTGRLLFGKRAEAYLQECRNLPSLLALGLRPMPPRPETKARLMMEIRQSLHCGSSRKRTSEGRGLSSPESTFSESFESLGCMEGLQDGDAFEAPLHYEASCRN